MRIPFIRISRPNILAISGNIFLWLYLTVPNEGLHGMQYKAISEVGKRKEFEDYKINKNKNIRGSVFLWKINGVIFEW